MTACHQWWAGLRRNASTPPPPAGNVFQLRGQIFLMSYASVYGADVPGAVQLGSDNWSIPSNPVVYVHPEDNSLVTLTGLGTCPSVMTREPAVEGPCCWEVVVVHVEPGMGDFSIGLCGSTFVTFNSSAYAGGAPGSGYTATHYESDGQFRKNSGVVLTGAPLAEGDVVGIVASSPLVSNAARFYINGVFVGTTDINAPPVSAMVTQKAA